MTSPTTAAPVPILGYTLAMSSAILFASKGVLIKLAYAEGLDAIAVLALRMAFAVPVFLAVGLWTVLRSGQDLPKVRDLAAACGTGLIGYWIASYTDFVGLEYLSPQFERLILFTYPLFVVILGALFFGVPIKMKPLAAFGFSYLGLAVVFVTDFRQQGASVAVGTAWVLVSAVTFALYQLLAKASISRLGAPLFTSVAMTAASIAILIQFVLTRPIAVLATSERGLLIGAAIAIFATILPAYLMSASLSRISAAANATIGTLSPVATLILAVLVLGETIGPVEIAGTAMVIGGVALYTRLDRRG